MSASSYLLEDEEGKGKGGFGRSSGKGSGIMVVYAIMRCGSLLTYDESGFLGKDGWLIAKGDRESPGADLSNVSNE